MLVIKDALRRAEEYFKTKFEYIIDLDPTSPLRLVSDIILSFKKFKRKKVDLLITGCEAKKNPYFNMFEVVNNKVKLVKNRKHNFISRQSAPKVYEMNASIYIWKKDALIRAKKLFLRNMTAYIMPRERSIDIDNQLDFEIVKKLIKKNEEIIIK
jgi:CMP-N,N'-diacetyllegionaminic acid synthase